MENSYSVNVGQLREKFQERCKNRIKIYEKILEKCYKRISALANKDEVFCLFQVPEFVIGYPLYNLPYCAAYIINNLKKNGYGAKFYNPNIIFIIWTYDQPFYFDTPKLITAPYPIADKSTKQNFRSIKDYTPSGNFLFN